MRVPVCCPVLAVGWGLGDVNRVVLFVASSRNVLAIGGGCCLPVRGRGHTLFVVPPLLGRFPMSRSPILAGPLEVEAAHLSPLRLEAASRYRVFPRKRFRSGVERLRAVILWGDFC